jgi:hypothetical protein
MTFHLLRISSPLPQPSLDSRKSTERSVTIRVWMAPHMFQFGFEGDDIEGDSAEQVQMHNKVHGRSGISEEPSQKEPELHSLDCMVCV